jgi:hypothetical protein
MKLSEDQFENIAVHESKNSEKILFFVPLWIKPLTKYCSARYANKIIHAKMNGQLYGLYQTKSGRIRANFI